MNWLGSKRTLFLLLFSSLTLGGTLATVPFLTAKPASAVSGQYTGIKLPYPNGQSRLVNRGGSAHASGRHAVDFDMKNEDVLAIKGGKVALATTDQYGGKYLLIDHNDGFCSIYLHLNSFYVSQNQQVEQGQRIGQSGNTGNSSGPHLHLAVFQKRPNQGCNADPSQEVAMIFDEKPDRELVNPDKIVSKNGIPFASTPYLPSTVLTIGQQSIDLKVCAANLPNQVVSVSLWRPAVGQYAARSWPLYRQVATGNCVQFTNLDGDGPTLSGVNYYTVASLSPIAADEAAKPPRSSCYGITGGLQLCDAKSRP